MEEDAVAMASAGAGSGFLPNIASRGLPVAAAEWSEGFIRPEKSGYRMERYLTRWVWFWKYNAESESLLNDYRTFADYELVIFLSCLFLGDKIKTKSYPGLSDDVKAYFESPEHVCVNPPLHPLDYWECFSALI